MSRGRNHRVGLGPRPKLPRAGSRLRLSGAGFTLTELLISIGIIAILAGILIPALGSMRKKAKDATSAAQLNSIANANEQYKISFLSYAVPVPDDYWQDASGTPIVLDQDHAENLTASESLLLGLMGGVTDDDSYPAFPDSTLYFNEDAVGSGPMVLTGSQQKYGAFYSPKKGEMARVGGTWDGTANGVANGTENPYPEFVDKSYGLPILYFRARGSWVRPANLFYDDATPGGNGAFSLAPVYDYVRAENLYNSLNTVSGSGYASPGWSQSLSLLNPDLEDDAGVVIGSPAKAVETLAWMVINRKLSNLTTGPNEADDVPKAGFSLMSSGADHIYLSREQGDRGTNPTGIAPPDGQLDAESMVEQFDDIVISGGTAP